MMEFVIDSSIKNIPDSIRKSVERNFTKFFARETKTVFDGTDIIEKIKAFNRIVERFKGFEGKVVLYHNECIRTCFMKKLMTFRDKDYSDCNIPEDLFKEFRSNILYSINYCMRFAIAE